MNCQEDWGLCNREGIQSYPSLVLYPGVRFVYFLLCLFSYQLGNILLVILFHEYEEPTEPNFIFLLTAFF